MTYHTHKLTHTFVIVDASTDVASLDAGGEEIFDARDTKDAADYVAGVMAYEALQELAKLPSAELRARSLYVSCRFYSCALSQLAAAKDAWRLGDERTAGLHVDQAEKAWLRALELRGSK